MSELHRVPKGYGFEGFEVRLDEGTLFRNGYNVPLQDQPFRLLCLLVSRAGTVVTREEIQAHLWPANTNVEFDKSLRVAVSKLREALRDSASTPTYIETLPRRGYRFLLPVTLTERAGADPLVSRLELPGMAPDGDALATSHPAQPSAADIAPAPIRAGAWRLPPISRILPWAAIAAVVLVIALDMVRRKQGQEMPPPVAARTFARRSVAVLGLRNLSGSANDRWLSTGLSEMLSTELSTSDQLRVISGEEVARAGLSDPPANTPSHESLVRDASKLGVDMIVFGSYTVTRGSSRDAASQMRLELRMEDMSAEAQSVTLVRTGKSTDLFSLVSATGTDLRRHFGLGDVSPEAANAVRRTLPSDPEAARLYADGLSHLRDFDPPGARDLLLRAARIEPTHAGTHLALADAWHTIGYIPEAQAEAKRAVDLGVGLPREELLTMQGELATLSYDWPRAIEIYHSLLVLYPDDIETGLRLVAAQNGANRYPDAFNTLKGLRRPGMASADEATLDLSEATTNVGTGDFRPAITDADRAIATAAELQNNLVRAAALASKAFSLERLGESQNSLAASMEAQNLYRAANDKKGLAVAVLTSGDVLYDRGQTADARRDFFTALELFRGIGHRGNVGLSMERIGNSYYREGALVESRKYYQQALEIYRELHAEARIASAIGNIANVKETEGDITGALRGNAECLTLAEKTGSKREIASTLSNMGGLEVERGTLEQAAADYDRAAETDRQIGYTRGLSHALAGQGDVLLERNDLSGALRQYDLAAKAVAGMDEPEVRLPARIGEGAAYLLSGRTDQAVEALREVVDGSVKIKEHGLATVSLVWLSRTLLVQGHMPEALDAANQALTESQAQFAPQERAMATLARGRVMIAQGKLPEAQAELHAALMIAERHGYELLTLELRILLAQTIRDTGRSRSQLSELAKIADAHGWHRLAADARKTNG